MSNLIITISREFASGGRLVGERLALQLGIPFYDKAIINLAAEKSGLSSQFIEQTTESIPSSSFLFGLAVSAASAPMNLSMHYDTPVNDKAFYAQAAVIRELAERSSCIIIGRCADYVLREHDNLIRLFVYAPKEDRIVRATRIYKETDANIAEKIRKIDKSRANYYKYYTGENWGNLHNYDLAINSSSCGIDGTVEMLKTLLREKKLIL
jgi:cytidylate kinase